jgi:DNA-binding Xre family transcriptional regulator
LLPIAIAKMKKMTIRCGKVMIISQSQIYVLQSHLICGRLCAYNEFYGVQAMGASYKRLWHLLIDRDMRKQQLVDLTGMSSSTLAKLTRGDNVSTNILVRICTVLNCDFSDIMEMVHTDKPNTDKSRTTYERKE